MLSGPTVNLRPDQQQTGINIEHFLYFIPLISPVPVFVHSKTDSTQRVHILSVNKKQNNKQIELFCTFEIRGVGFYHNALDQSLIIKRHAEEFRRGKNLENLLGHIIFSGEGSGFISAEGVLIDGKPQMEKVRIDFQGKNESPIKIGLFSVRLENGDFVNFNEMRVEISTLMFIRTEKKPKMRVMVNSVKAQAAPDNLWEDFKGAVKGKLANLIIPPVSIAPVGNNVILDLTQAIYSELPEFTFPLATNLTRQIQHPISQKHSGF